MNNTLTELLCSLDTAKDKVCDAENARDRFLEPILKELKATGGGVSHCSIYGDDISITRSGSCRGSGWDDNYLFPLSIFTSEDPTAAAQLYMTEKKKKEEAYIRKDKLAKIKQLQKELGE